MGRIKDNSPSSREEDYRDFEERDLEEGWPYADDGTAAQGSDNRPYGGTANFDSDGNAGFRLDGIDRDGNENRLREPLPHAIHREEADDLEARGHRG